MILIYIPILKSLAYNLDKNHNKGTAVHTFLKFKPAQRTFTQREH